MMKVAFIEGYYSFSTIFLRLISRVSAMAVRESGEWGEKQKKKIMGWRIKCLSWCLECHSLLGGG